MGDYCLNFCVFYSLPFFVRSKRSIFDAPEITYRKKKPRPRSKKLCAVDEEEGEEIKLVLDMSPDGPTFAALESIMMAASEAFEASGGGGRGAANGVKGGGKRGKAGGAAGKKGGYDQLTKLLKSGIPGEEKIFSSLFLEIL